ncbi:FAD-dependent oxidoreductase [Paraburkholderia caledonica]|uniref:NADH dehydrogenase FAD-containing subunit n=1 Tax=Paraburkholderia caledonica TaxID=134536 RepID=A0AB73IPD7_9BURK|nr:NADH dehydrogenase FAD-containing subunit [Paraburkholderia caledonica]
MAIARARLRNTEASAQQMGAVLLPARDAPVVMESEKQSYNNGFPPALVPRGWRPYDSTELNYDIDFWEKSRALLAGATSELDAARPGGAQARMVLAALIADAYVDLARQFAERDSADAAERTQAKQQSEGVDFFELDESIALTRNRIAALISTGVDRGLRISRPAFDLTQPVGMPADVALGRPTDVMIARLRAEAITKQIDVTKASFCPNVNLSSMIGFQSLGLVMLTQPVRLPAMSVRPSCCRLSTAASCAARKRRRLQMTESCDAAAQSHRVAPERYQGGLSIYLDALSAADMRLRHLLGAAILLAGLDCGGYRCPIGSRYVSTGNAYTAAEIASITPSVSGIAQRVAAVDMQHARKGEALAHSDSVSGNVCGRDRQRKEVLLNAVRTRAGDLVLEARTVTYDVLLLSLGSRANDFDPPGVTQYCHFIDSQEQAEGLNGVLHARMLRAVVRDERLWVAIVGAGATGVELAAGLSRVLEIAQDYGDPMLRTRLSLTLLESGPRVLAAFLTAISESTQQQLEHIGFRMLTSARATAAQEDGCRHGENRLAKADLMVWAAGVRAPDLISGLAELETDRSNQIGIDAGLQSTRDEQAFSLADCASSTTENHARALPPTAQVTTQQAEHLARHLPAWRADVPMPRFAFPHFGSLVALSGYGVFGTLVLAWFLPQRFHSRAVRATRPRDALSTSSAGASWSCQSAADLGRASPALDQGELMTHLTCFSAAVCNAAIPY